MEKLALFYNFRDFVIHSEFTAGIVLHGRATLAYEDDAWWMYGVQPGAIAGTGDTPRAAYLDLCQTMHKVILDFASDAKTFEEFDGPFKTFFNEVNVIEEAGWNQLAQDLREGKLAPKNELSNLPKRPMESPGLVCVTRLDGAKAKSGEDVEAVCEVAEPLAQAA